MGVLCGWSSSGGSCSKGPGGGGTPGHQRAPLASYSLSANQLGDDGLRRLLECLPQVPICGSLDLSHNGISREGALCLVETLPSCPRVREASVR